MRRFIPFSALKTNQREVKDAALEGVVRVTENGRGAFVFCSGDVFDRRLRAASYFLAYSWSKRVCWGKTGHGFFGWWSRRTCWGKKAGAVDLFFGRNRAPMRASLFLVTMSGLFIVANGILFSPNISLLTTGGQGGVSLSYSRCFLAMVNRGDCNGVNAHMRFVLPRAFDALVDGNVYGKSRMHAAGWT